MKFPTWEWGNYPASDKAYATGEQKVMPEGIIGASPKENLFTIGGRRFILLDRNEDGEYFIMADEEYGTTNMMHGNWNAAYKAKTQEQVKKLIAGPDVYICDECVELCNEILDEEFLEEKEKTTEKADIIVVSYMLNELEEAIASLFFEGAIEATDLTYVSNARHISLLTLAKSTITDALEAAQNDVPVDMIQIDVTRTWEILGEITGDTVEESLIDQLFSQFCLGK